MKIDKEGYQVNMDVLPFKTHQGDLFEASISATIGAGGTLALSIKPPNTADKATHLILEVSANKAGNFIFAKGDTISGGSDVTANNLNFNSSKTYAGAIKKDATRDTPGTTVKTVIVGATMAPYIESERVLVKNTVYTILFTADGVSTTVSINAKFYEGSV
jgi:hypothetical protein